MIGVLLRNVSRRMNSENNLSDMTWALAETVPAFKSFFVKYFFPEIKKPEMASLYREYPLSKGGRPDFMIWSEGSWYLLENKKDDTDYHFQEYSACSDTDGIVRFSIILNHKLDSNIDRCGFRESSWKDFVSHLDSELFSAEDETYIDAYSSYVKEVCGLVKIEKVQLNRWKSLHDFYHLAVSVIDGFGKDGLSCELYSAPQRSFSPEHVGSYFTLSKSGAITETIYPFMGLYFGAGVTNPVIYCAFESDWCKRVYEKYKGKALDTEAFSISTSVSDSEIEFELHDDMFQSFLDADVDTQKAILADFFSKVVEEVSQHL